MGSGVVHRLLLLGVTAVAGLTAGVARAEEQNAARPPPVLPELAVAAGVAFPWGTAERDLGLDRRVRALARFGVGSRER